MSAIPSLSAHLAPDCIRNLERAAELRFEDAESLRADSRFLSALYLYGYAVEMCLTAACFRCEGFSLGSPIGRELRGDRMTQARKLRAESGALLMSSDPHPLDGWARYLKYKRMASRLNSNDFRRLTEAVNKADLIYRHWRPDLRYKIVKVAAAQLEQAREAARWFVENRTRF